MMVLSLAVLACLVSQGLAETLGYSLDPAGVQLEDETVTGRVYAISKTWTFQSNRTLITKWKIYNGRPGENISFHLWHHDADIVKDTSEVFRMVAKSKTFTTSGNSYEEFVQDPPMDAHHGDFVAIAFTGRNPVPYREIQNCQEKYWTILSPEDADVNSRYTGTVGTCRQYLVQVEYKLRPIDSSINVRRFGGNAVSRRTLSDDIDGMIIENPTKRLPKRVRVLGWQAFMERANVKVRFVSVRRSDSVGDEDKFSYYITHESEEYWVRQPGKLTTYYSSDQFPVYIDQGDLIGLLYTDGNPIPYDNVPCNNEERTLSIPSLESQRKVQTFTQDQTDRICRMFSFALLYKDESIETTKRTVPTTTSIPTRKPGSTISPVFPRPCEVVKLQRGKSGEKRSSKPLPERECWRLSVPDPGYIIKVEVLHLELGDCPAADRVDIRDGDSDVAYPLLENVCSDDFKCVSCGNKMYVRVKTSSKSDTKGIRFRYTVVPKDRYPKCGNVTDIVVDKSTSIGDRIYATTLTRFLPLVIFLFATL